MSKLRDENLLGALGLAVTDAMWDNVSTQAGRAPTVAAALVTAATFADLSIEELRHHLRLSHPATVRLVDRLVDDGLLRRRPIGPGRTLALVLTQAGETAAAEVEAARHVALQRALQGLSAGERQSLTSLAEKMLGHLTGDRRDAHRICRLCAQHRCHVRPQGCPVDRGASN